MTLVSKIPSERYPEPAAVQPVHPIRPASSADTSSNTSFYAAYGKRALDLLLVIAAAPFVVPIVLTLAFLVWCSGGRPFYSQDRIGRNGRIYRIRKLRTMVHDAEDALAAYLEANPAARIEWTTQQKLKHDPRVTRFGLFLRRTSLDELPQLWNVFVGEMSLVGPRPMMPDQADLYPCTRYYSMRPGITGFWQVLARNNSSFQDRAGFDARYYEAMSLWTDLKMLFATVRVVLRATGQ